MKVDYLGNFTCSGNLVSAGIVGLTTNPSSSSIIGYNTKYTTGRNINYSKSISDFQNFFCYCNYTLTPGVWRVDANMAYSINTAFNQDIRITLMVTTNGTSFTNTGSNQFAAVQVIPAGSKATDSTVSNTSVWTVTSSTTIYLTAYLDWAYNSGTGAGAISLQDTSKSGFIITRIA